MVTEVSDRGVSLSDGATRSCYFQSLDAMVVVYRPVAARGVLVTNVNRSDKAFESSVQSSDRNKSKFRLSHCTGGSVTNNHQEVTFS